MVTNRLFKRILVLSITASTALIILALFVIAYISNVHEKMNSLLDQDTVAQTLSNQNYLNTVMIFIAVIVSIILLIAVLTLSIHNYISKKQILVNQKLLKVGSGNYNESENDHDILGTEFVTMMRNLREISNVMQRIAKGEIDLKIDIKSPENILGTAVNDIVNILQNDRLTFNETTWLRDGITEMGDLFLDELSLAEVTNRGIRYICQYINAFCGIIYVYDENNKLISYSSSYAYVPNENFKATYTLSEGAVGEVAISGSYLEYNHIKNTYAPCEMSTTVDA